MYTSMLLYLHTQSSEWFYQMADYIMMFSLPAGTLSVTPASDIHVIYKLRLILSCKNKLCW